MGSQHLNGSKSSPKEGQKSGPQALLRSDAHTNSARAGENPNRDDDAGDAVQEKPQHDLLSRNRELSRNGE